MKAKSVFVGIAVVAVVLFLLSITAVSKVLSASPRDLIAGVKTQPIAAKFLPKQSPLVASFLVNPEKLSLFATLAAKPGDRAHLRSEFNSLKQQIERTWSLNYDRDIKSWLGDEITLAVTTADIDRESQNGYQPGYLLALAVKDQNIARKSFEKFWQNLAVKGSDIAFEQYQGISIIHTTGNARQAPLAGAIFGKFAVFANHAKVIRNAINDLQVPDLALVNSDLYRQSLSELKDGRVAIAFVNTDELGAWGTASKFFTDKDSNLPNLGLALGLGLDPLGIKAETVLTQATVANANSTSTANKQGNQNQAVQYLPVGSSLFTGHDLSQTWQQLQANLQTYPEIGSGLAAWMGEIENNLGFNLNQDLVAWVKGDYAIAVLPTKNKNQTPDWVVVAQNTDPNATKAALQNLDAVARNKANLTVGEVNVNNRNLTVWTRLSAVLPKSQSQSPNSSTVTGNVAAVHAQSGDYTFIASSIEAIESVLENNKNSITKSSTFKSVTSKLPSNHQTYAYLDDHVNLQWLTNRFPIVKSFQSLSEPALSHVRAVNLTNVAKTSSDSSNIHKGQIFVALK